jgi:hypothetical protein
MIADGALRRVRGYTCTPMRMDNGIWRRYCVLYEFFVKKCSLDKDSACILLASFFLTFYTLILILPQYYPIMFTKLSLPHVCCAVICLGWAIGSKDFKKGLLSEEAERSKSEAEGAKLIGLKQERYDGKELREANELKWELFLERGLSALGKDATAIRADKKSAAWKVMLASVIKKHTSATNVWITGKLNMGIPQAVSQVVGNFYAAGGNKTEGYKELTINITT